MAESNSSKTASATEDPKGKSKSTQAVVDYLQAPRKKRKSYIILAASQNIDTDTIQAIQRFIKSQYPKLTFVTIKNPDDLLKYSQKNIVLAIIDDQLTKREETLKIIKKLKEQKSEGPLPTLFLTKEPEELVSAYKKELHAWHEVDEYIEFPDAPRHAIFRKIKTGIETKYQRRGRRYKVNIPVFFQVLDSGEKKFPGTIVDFSIHGALLTVNQSQHHFSAKDQIIVHIPLSKYIKGEADIFRLSARVRRVLISGDKAGISWEYLSDEKVTTMTKLLMSIVNVALAKSASATRLRIAQANEAAKLPQAEPKPAS